MELGSGIERRIVLEMEREIESSKPVDVNISRVTATLPPPPRVSSTECLLAQKEGDAIRAEIEKKLQTWQEKQECHDHPLPSANTGSCVSSSYRDADAFGGAEDDDKENDDDDDGDEGLVVHVARPIQLSRGHERLETPQNIYTSQIPNTVSINESKTPSNMVETLASPLRKECPWRENVSDGNDSSCMKLGCDSDGILSSGEEVAVPRLLVEKPILSNGMEHQNKKVNVDDGDDSNDGADGHNSKSKDSVNMVNSGAGEHSTFSNGSLLSGIPVTDVHNCNGILSDSTEDESNVFFDEAPPHEAYETHAAGVLSPLGLAESDTRTRHVMWHVYETKREPGRCLYPPGEEREGDLSAVSIQLGFFRSKQIIISNGLRAQRRVAERERPAGPDQRSLGTLQCFFEQELLQDPSVTFDDEDLPHNAPSESLITEHDLATKTASAVLKSALSRLTFGDPIQVWERARDRSFDLCGPTGANVERQTTCTIGSTTNCIWVNEVETIKPIPSVGVFTGGTPFRVECTKIGGPMIEMHGNSVDPLVLSVFFFSATPNNKMKVSETFFFDLGVDIFYPHKERDNLNRKNHAVAFIPREFISSLYLAVRVFRPASEDYDDYVDLYARPDRYKTQHLIPMKQETQLLTMSSDVLEELGWNIVRCQEERKSTESIEVKNLYRKNFSDAQLFRFVDDERSRGSLRTLPIELEFTLSDCTAHEVSFPSQCSTPRPEENETLVNLLNPDIPGARPETSRYVPCAIPILNSGFFHSYHNVYYFRLHNLKLSSSGYLRKLPSTHRTYLMQICVKDQDVSLVEEGLPLLYGRRLSAQVLETSLWTSTIHNCSDFELSDEIKVQLPLYLTDAHHIFITLYAAHLKKNPAVEGQQRLYKLGYAAFPITRHGVVQVRESWDIKFVSADQAVVIAAGGYLTKFSEAPSSALLNNGNPVLQVSTQTRTSLYASNRIIAGILKNTSSVLERIVRGDDALLNSRGLSAENADKGNENFMEIMGLMRQLPLAEILAFYPLLSSLNLAIISSPSGKVNLDCRTAALDQLIDISFKAHHYGITTLAYRRRQGDRAHQEASTLVRTSVTMYLYHFLSNDLLYNGQRFRIYAGLATTWLHLLHKIKQLTPEGLADAAREGSGSAAASAAQPPRNIKKEMTELLWFLFGVILRSVYIWTLENPGTSRKQLFEPSFYTLIGKLCTEVLGTLNGFANSGVVARQVALFVRNLCNCCDRGHMLNVYQRIVDFLEEHVDVDGLSVFLRLILEDAHAVTLMLPSASYKRPIFLTRILVGPFSRLLMNRDREKRAAATRTLYEFICRLSNNPHFPAVALSWVASQLFALLWRISANRKTYQQLYDKVDDAIAAEDKRQLAIAMLWIVYYSPRGVIRDWLVKRGDDKILSGFIGFLTDAQVLLRYSAGVDKADSRGTKKPSTELREWDGRMSTFATAIGSRMCSIFLEDIPCVLQTIQRNKMVGVVLPFFVMLESLLHLGNSTVALQISSCAFLEVVCSLFPVIISGTVRLSSGVVLLVFRLMSSCSMHVRTIASHIYFLMCRSFFEWNNALARMKSLTANALVSVAESKSRNLRLVGRFIQFQLEDLSEKARRADGEPFVPPSPKYNALYKANCSQSGGDAGMSNRHHDVEPLFLSVECRIPISQYLLEGENRTCHTDHKRSSNAITVDAKGNEKAPPRFSEEFLTMSQTALSLFNDVLRLQMDRSMQFKEEKVFAYFEVVQNFLRQNALPEVLKWLYRLHELHKTNNNLTEAGMVLFFVAALCFRVTEVFWYIRGRDSRGAHMPFGLFSHVFWHDYVRVLPEVDMLLPADTVYAIVSEMYVCPDDSCFTVEGQVKALREAAEHLDKEHYYVFSISTIAILDKYLRAINDFKGAAAVHTAMATWCTAVSKNVCCNHRYFLLWARMERAEGPKKRRELQDEELSFEPPRGLPDGSPIKRVYKMPSTTTLPEFEEYCKAYISSFFEDSTLVVLVDELTETLPALPEPNSKKKRIAAMQHPPNRCWVTVCEVHASFEKGKPVPPDGFDKTMHIQKFQNIIYVHPNSSVSVSETIGMKSNELKNMRMSINTYQLQRAFPSTTSAIDIVETGITILDEFETAKVTIEKCIEMIKQVSEDDGLITVLREALSPMGITPPGAYIKYVISTMGSHVDILDAVRALSMLVREKLTVCARRDVPAKSSNDYALVLKAVTDIECCLIAVEDEACKGSE